VELQLQLYLPFVSDAKNNPINVDAASVKLQKAKAVQTRNAVTHA
jgi:hypothetical protein